MENKFISWRRVSTKKQGKSGLGLEAQKQIIQFCVDSCGGSLVADYCESHTGKDLRGCAMLREAIAHAKSIGARLIIAKADRFRNVREALEIFDEMDGKITFCDAPPAEDAATARFIITLLFAFAEREALINSLRTKAGLAHSQKQSGRKKGEGATKEILKMALEARRINSRSDKSNVDAWNAIELKASDIGKKDADGKALITWQALAQHLNSKHLQTRKGGEWRPNQVKRLAMMMAS